MDGCSADLLSGLAGAEREFAAALVRRLPARIERQLTPVELDLLQLLAAGLTTKEISSELAKSDSTVQRQTQTILRKFGVPCRSRLVARLAVLSDGAGRVAAAG